MSSKIRDVINEEPMSRFQLLSVAIRVGLDMLASISVITADYAANEWRSNAISLQVIGYPTGATIGGGAGGIW